MDLANQDVRLLIFLSYTDMVFQKSGLLSEVRQKERMILRLKVTARKAYTSG